MRKILGFVAISLLLTACFKEKKPSIDVSKIPVTMNVERFEVDFYGNQELELPALKAKYPKMFPAENDSVWERKRTDKDELELYRETHKVFKKFDDVEADLVRFFQYVKHYNPNFLEPEVFTVISNIDYQHRVIYNGEVLVISLDAYLGETHEFYGDYPGYIRHNNTRERIVVDVANALVQQQVRITTGRRFIEKVVNRGKQLYVLSQYLPFVAEPVLLGYSPEKLAWASANEEEVWRYFVGKDLLYSTDKSLDRRFLDLAPFSKFYMAHDNDSPGQIGAWIGLQIVNSFMENNDVSLQELIKTNEEQIFAKSKYKPRR